MSLGALPLLLAPGRIEYRNRPVIEHSECGDHAGEKATRAPGSSIWQPLQYRYPLPQ